MKASSKSRKFVALALMVAATGVAHATDGTVNISGSVSSATCTITTTSISVTMPTVSRTSLDAATKVAGLTPWSVSVSSCNAATINTYFEHGGSVNAAGRLINYGTAANVEGQVLTSTMAVVNLNSGSQGTTPVAVSGGAATQQFYIQYYATGTAGAGTFQSNFKFTLLYP